MLSFFFNSIKKINSSNNETGEKPQSVSSEGDLKFSPMKTKAVAAFIDRLSTRNTTAALTLVNKITESGCLLVSQRVFVVFGRKGAVSVNNTTVSP